jgi:hypothetical protein
MSRTLSEFGIVQKVAELAAKRVTEQTVNAARKVRRGGAPNRALEKCGMAPLMEEHVCRYGRVD